MKKILNRKKIHNNLQRTKVRAMLLFPSMVIMIIGMLIGLSSVYYGYIVPKYVFPIYVINMAYFTIVVLAIFWSDYIKIKNKYKYK